MKKKIFVFLTLAAIVWGAIVLTSCVTVAALGTGFTIGHVAVNDAHKLKDLIIEVKKLKAEAVK